MRRGWQDEVIDDAEYQEQAAELTAAREAAAGAPERAREHVQAIEWAPCPETPSSSFYSAWRSSSELVGEGIGDAPDLPALRNVIAELFEEAQLVDDTGWPRLDRLQQHPTRVRSSRSLASTPT